MYKKYSVFFLVSFILSLAIPLLVNFYIDPYNFYNSHFTDFITVSEERKIKLSYLRTHKRVYDSVLIGSSRSSYIDVSKISGFKVFNLSVSGIALNEYLPYLEFFKETQGVPKLIILSLDFHSTNANYESNVTPDMIINDVKSVLKRNLDYSKLKTLNTSVVLATTNQETLNDYYTRDLIKKRFNQTKILEPYIIEETISYYKKNCLKNYKYREDFFSQILAIRNAFPNTRIIVLICPIHQSLINLQRDIAGNFYHQKWLFEIKSVFENLIDFTDNATITNNPNNFFDAAHFYPFVGHQILDELKNHDIK
jgi:hypothetical protein